MGSTKTLEQVIETLIDYRGKTPTKTESGVRLITAKVIKDGRINDSSFEYIAEEDYDAWMRRGLPCQNDILITTEAPLGEVAMLRTAERVALAQRVILLRARPSEISQQFLFQALKSPSVQAELQSRATGTTVLGIKQSELWNVRVPCPPMQTQERIADVLSSYEDLIENNTKRIKILEEMARSLYREWFVNFRFPGHEKAKFINSKFGKVPEGWATKRIDEIASVNARSIRRDEVPDFVDYVDIASVSPGVVEKMDRFTFEAAPGRARRLVQAGDTIWSTVRPNRRSYAFLASPPPTMVVSTGFAVLSPQAVPPSFLYFAVTTDEFVAYIMNRTRGAAYPACTGRDFEEAPILVANDAMMARFESVAGPILEGTDLLRQKNNNLRATRDLLLPRLISGEIDVSSLRLETAAS